MHPSKALGSMVAHAGAFEVLHTASQSSAALGLVQEAHTCSEDAAASVFLLCLLPARPLFVVPHLSPAVPSPPAAASCRSAACAAVLLGPAGCCSTSWTSQSVGRSWQRCIKLVTAVISDTHALNTQHCSRKGSGRHGRRPTTGSGTKLQCDAVLRLFPTTHCSSLRIQPQVAAVPHPLHHFFPNQGTPGPGT